MKKYLSVMLLCGFVLSVSAQDSKDAYLIKQLTSDAIQHVKCETTGGNISVTGSDAEARIEVYVWANNGRNRDLSKEEIKKRLEEDYELTVTAENHTLTAIAKPKHNFRDWNHGLSISFTIFVPHASSTDLRTSGGNIDMSSLTGTQDFGTSGGNLNVDHLSGHIKGRTSGGNITMSDLKDDIDLSTSGGSINAKDSHGTMTLTTSGGSVQLRSLDGTIKAGTSGGNIHADGVDGELSAHTSGGNVDMYNLTCTLETSTSGGNIDVSLKTLGKYVRISNSGGSVSLQIPQDKGVDLNLSADRVTASTLSGFKGDIKKDHIEGTINGGGVPVTVHGGSNIHFSIK
jgi:hypothetical protein